MNSTICPSCNRPIRPGARFCGSCGMVLKPDQQTGRTPQPISPIPPQPGAPQKVSQQPSPTPTPLPSAVKSKTASTTGRTSESKKTSKKMPELRCPLRSNVRFCGKCGAQIGIDTSQPTKERGRLWLVVVLLILLMTATTFIFYLYIFGPLGTIGGIETPTVEITPGEEETGVPAALEEFTLTPTITITETIAIPTETQEVPTLTPTETPIPTDTPTMTPVPTLTTHHYHRLSMKHLPNHLMIAGGLRHY
jgi:hypothetical protein